MYAVEFKTIIKDGIIKIPFSYINQLSGDVKVIVLKEDQVSNNNVSDEIIKISKRCASLPDRDKRSADEILGYDKIGAPA